MEAVRKGMWLVLLVFAGSFPVPQRSPAPQALDCASCSGSGTALQPCLQCGGSGQIECRLCNPSADYLKGLDRDVWATDEQRAELVESARDLHRVRLRFRETMEQGAMPGRAPCPAHCRGGKVLQQPRDECKYCDGKGARACPRCKQKGFVPCLACAGKKRTARACEDCLGSGRRADPATLAARDRASCPLCSGRGTWSCTECTEGSLDGACTLCDGLGVTFCRTCLASGERPCNKCYASGNLSSFHAAKTSNACDQCGRSGRIACGECPGKPVACSRCNGERHGPRPCLACLGKRERACLGCLRGAFGSWERAGDGLLASGEARAALECYEIARGRVDGYFDRLAAEALDPEESAAAREKSRREASRRLEARIEAAKAGVR